MNESGGSGPGDAPHQDEPGDRPDLDVDSAFAAIVAGFSDSVPHGIGPWPAVEDLSDDDNDRPPTGSGDAREGEPRVDGPRDGGPRPGDHRGEAVGDLREGPRPADDDTEDDEGFVPPVPPPLPRGDLVSRTAWGAVIGGPLFLLLAALAWRNLPSSLLLLALAAFVGGFITLVARMPQEPPDDPDDGAVV